MKNAPWILWGRTLILMPCDRGKMRTYLSSMLTEPEACAMRWRRPPARPKESNKTKNVDSRRNSNAFQQCNRLDAVSWRAIGFSALSTVRAFLMTNVVREIQSPNTVSKHWILTRIPKFGIFPICPFPAGFPGFSGLTITRFITVHP